LPDIKLARLQRRVSFLPNLANDGIITLMKSFLLFTFLTIAVAIACAPNRSAGSPTVPNNNAGTTAVSSQTENAPTQDKAKCTLTLASAPALIGLRLGMTTDEVLALFKGSKDDAELHSDLSRLPNQFGALGFIIRPAKYENKEKFTGINQISFTLLDSRVSDFTFHYNGPEYSHVDKFVTKFVEGTNLPATDQWEAYVGMDNQLKTLTCSEFEVRVFAGGQGGNLNYVLMRDLEADKKLKERRAKARAAASPTP
jgi:hypothetical protein